MGQSLRSIAVTYPDFQSLPMGVKSLLVTSESLYFGDAKNAPAEMSGREEPVWATLNGKPVHFARTAFHHAPT